MYDATAGMDQRSFGVNSMQLLPSADVVLVDKYELE